MEQKAADSGYLQINYDVSIYYASLLNLQLRPSHTITQNRKSEQIYISVVKEYIFSSQSSWQLI